MVSETINTLDNLSVRIGIPKLLLTRYVFAADKFYREFRISKRNGVGQRVIAAPSRELRGIQRWILYYMLREESVHSASTAFRPGCSIFKNALPHCNKKYLLCMDIQKFFPTISTGRVFGLFRSLGYDNEMAFGLSRLCTYKGQLPQGAPTSPEIANLICRKLDSRLESYAAKAECKYSRYADDLSFSGDSYFSQGFINTVRKILREEGFKCNERKTQLLKRNNRQMVTGLVVNSSPMIPRARKKSIRAIFFQARNQPENFVGRIDEIQGYISFLRMLNCDEPLIRQGKIALAAIKES